MGAKDGINKLNAPQGDGNGYDYARKYTEYKINKLNTPQGWKWQNSIKSKANIVI